LVTVTDALAHVAERGMSDIQLAEDPASQCDPPPYFSGIVSHEITSFQLGWATGRASGPKVIRRG